MKVDGNPNTAAIVSAKKDHAQWSISIVGRLQAYTTNVAYM